jgi:hypothetical protein
LRENLENNMKIHAKPIIALACGAILICGSFCQTTQAKGMLNESGDSTLADVNGAATGPEALTVSWSVVETAPSDYVYTYTVNNPADDVLLGGPNAGSPEIVDFFSVDFNTLVTGAVVSGPTGGTGSGVAAGGVSWGLDTPVVNPGTTSGPLSFDSELPPSPGDATANDSNPPAPWASFPDGQVVPVPGTGNFPVPDSTNSMALLAGVLLLLPFGSAMRKKAGSGY